MSTEQESLIDQWDSLISNIQNYEIVESHAIQGLLRHSAIRTIYWRVMLGCLPYNRDLWSKALVHDREAYEGFKKSLTAKPDEEIFGLSLDLNNPLSLEQESPWNQYFVDQNLKDLINNDVNRTFPEIEFFAHEENREILKNVLFIYAKKHQKLSYRQGMHEILAPLLFALHSDYSSYKHYEEQDLLPSCSNDRSLLKQFNDDGYVEHDVYALFVKVMSIVDGFYTAADEEETGNSYTDIFENGERKSNVVWIQKLETIVNMRLRDLDPELWNHLKNLDISPRLFGLRWLRLLFGREFSFHDLLFVWDVIFSDKPTFIILDDIFLAMLIQIRGLLLSSDYSGALQFLMRYPPIADVQLFINFCLYLRFPTKYMRPVNYGIKNFSHITLAGKPHPGQATSKSIIKRPLAPISVSASENSSSAAGRVRFNDQWPDGSVDEVELLKEQVALLQSNLNDKDLISRISSAKLLKLVPQLEELSIEASRREKIIEEIKEIANSLSSVVVPQQFVRSVSIRPEQYQMKNLETPIGGLKMFRQRSHSSATNKPSMRHSPRSLVNEKELKELHFGVKKNF